MGQRLSSAIFPSIELASGPPHELLMKPNFEHKIKTRASMDLCRPESLKPLADIVDEETAVVLMAAHTPDKGDNWASCDANIRMAGNVCEALLAKPPGKFVFMSSDAVYPMGDEPVTEATPVNPEDSFYALAKFTGECLGRKLLGGGAASRS